MLERDGDTALATEVAGILLTAMELEMLDEVKAENRAGYEEKAKQRTIADDVQTPDADGNYAYEFVLTANGDAAGQGGSSVSYSEGNSAYEFAPSAHNGGYMYVGPGSPASKRGSSGSADSPSASKRGSSGSAYSPSASKRGSFGSAYSPSASTRSSFGSADSQYIGKEESARLRTVQNQAYVIPPSQQGPEEETFGFGCDIAFG